MSDERSESGEEAIDEEGKNSTQQRIDEEGASEAPGDASWEEKRWGEQGTKPEEGEQGTDDVA